MQDEHHNRADQKSNPVDGKDPWIRFKGKQTLEKASLDQSKQHQLHAVTILLAFIIPYSRLKCQSFLLYPFMIQYLQSRYCRDVQSARRFFTARQPQTMYNDTMAHEVFVVS